MTILFTAVSVLSAALLFLLQPMVARMMLPAFGGSPQVWTTTMLFFQCVLLAGYGYTHVTTTRLDRRAQPWVHLVMMALPLALLPIGLTVVPSGRAVIAPSIELLTALTVGVAGPFMVIATTGPLVQRWFSWTDHRRAHDPYFLYAAGNLGSMGGLLLYPFAVEPYLDIQEQSHLWAVGYVLAFLLVAACVLVMRRRPGAAEPTPGTPQERGRAIPARRLGRWLLLAFVPSSLMLGATSLLSTDIAAVPLLWVLPLATYLLTFTTAFSRFGPAALRAADFFAPAVVALAVAMAPATFGVPTSVTLQVLLVAVGGLVAHGRLAVDRPPPSQLTRFYLVVAVGGALGGLFNGLVAPLVFPTVIEYGLVVALFMGLVIEWREIVRGAALWPRAGRLAAAMLLASIPVALLFLSSLKAQPASAVLRVAVVAALLAPLLTRFGRSGAVGLAVTLVALVPQIVQAVDAELVDRTFFGVYRVTRAGSLLKLLHGTTVHGSQDLTSEASRRRAVSYYHPDEPFGDVMRLRENIEVMGVVGLGAGSVAAYGGPEQTIVFHEIDPAVVRIAKERFTYLEDTAASVEFVLGDGRLTLADAHARYGLLVIDAFTSDAIPVHLLTLEALERYLEAIERNGTIVLNISNRHLDLAPVLRAAAEELGLAALHRNGRGDGEGAVPSHWVAMARHRQSLQGLRIAGWSELPNRRELWTDQRSSIWSVLIRRGVSASPAREITRLEEPPIPPPPSGGG
ncbi:MAG: fused MFS/spermidine synthase [Thermoanaerobaculia bacterium]